MDFNDWGLAPQKGCRADEYLNDWGGCDAQGNDEHSSLFLAYCWGDEEAEQKLIFLGLLNKGEI